jgi:excisionase family DNA binding protein
MKRSDPEQLMTPMEAARFLGLSADYVRDLSNRGSLPTLRTMGGRRLFWRRDVEQLLEMRAQAPARKSRRATGTPK